MQASASDRKPLRHSPTMAVAVMAVLGLILGGTGYLYLSHVRESVKAEVHLRLNALAHDKAAQVGAWRAERLADAAVVAAMFRVSAPMQTVIRQRGSPQDIRQTRDLLDVVRQNYAYLSIALLDKDRRVVLTIGAPLDTERQDAPATIPEDAVALLGNVIRRPDGSDPRINITARITGGGQELLGFAVLSIDPRTHLFPTLRDWSATGLSDQLYLITQDGDDVVLLNDPKPSHSIKINSGQIPGLRASVNRRGLPSVEALRHDGIVDGKDLRGVDSLAAASSVPDSAWHVLAKLDASDVNAGEGHLIGLLVSLLILSMLLSGAGVELYQRRRSERFYQEKYQAETERNVLRDRYQSLISHASEAVLIWDESGRVLEANTSALKVFGYTHEEFMTLHLPDLKPAELREDVVVDFRKVMAGQDQTFETLNKRKDGTVFPSEISACRIDIGGEKIGQTLIRDISERRKAEQQIRRLNRLYAVLSRCNEAVFLAQDEAALFGKVARIAAEYGEFRIGWVGSVDAASGIIQPLAVEGPAAAYFRDIAITVDGPTGQGPTGICVRERRTAASTDFQTDAAMAPWRARAAEFGLRSSICLPILRNGSPEFVFGMYSSEPAFFSPEEIELAEEMAAGLTHALAGFELKREREIATERLERAFEVSNEAFLDWHIPDDQFYVSPRFYSLLGYNPGEISLDLNWLIETVHPDDRPVVEEKRRLLWSGKADQATARFRIRHKNGNYIWTLGRAGVVSRDQHGHPVRLVETRLDISEQEALEREFLQAQKMESIGRLAGGVAHDFNNHLTVIMGYAGLLKSLGVRDGSGAEMVQTILDAGERATALTRQLLAFSRKDTEKREPIRPDEAINGMRKILSHLTGEKIHLQFEPGGETELVMMDRIQLEQIIMNLTVNARDAIRNEGNVTIATRLATKDDQRFVVISVSDDGCGMTSEIREQIFEPFFTTKGRAHGTGLGLSTVWGIVEKSGGHIDVESEPGLGSSFHVWLPAVSQIELEPGANPQATAINGAGQIILVVDDEDAVRAVAQAVLRSHGYRTFAARNGSEALALADSGKPIDAALIDLVMPDMNGPQVAEQLLARRPGLKMLFCSGYASPSIDLSQESVKDIPVLGKPWDPEALVAALNRLLVKPGSA